MFDWLTAVLMWVTVCIGPAPITNPTPEGVAMCRGVIAKVSVLEVPYWGDPQKAGVGVQLRWRDEPAEP